MSFGGWIAPPTCTDASIDLMAALNVYLDTPTDFGPSGRSSPDFVAAERVRLMAANVSASSRSEIAAWGRAAADLNPSAEANRVTVSAMESLAKAGEDVVRACD